MKLTKVLTLMCTAVIGLAISTVDVQATNIKKGLTPGDQGYVGALNDRPSNSFTPSSSSQTILPMSSADGYWYNYEPTTINVLVRNNNNPTASGTV